MTALPPVPHTKPIPDKKTWHASRDPLDAFTPLTRQWFQDCFSAPTEIQRAAWPLISSGAHSLLLAPTGSGKTLASFLWSIDRLFTKPAEAPGVRLLYISPLKALNYDIERNLRLPLEGIRTLAEKEGVTLPEIRIGVRTGDTSASTRQSIVRRPPEILITTPESLYLMLTSPKARAIFQQVEWAIVDEIHAIAGSKRGTHLWVSLERLVEQHRHRHFQRIGLSATAKPVDSVAALLGGRDDDGSPRPVQRVLTTQIRKGGTRPLDLEIEFLPAAGENFPAAHAGPAFTKACEQITETVRAHTATLVFVPSRGLVEKMTKIVNENAGEDLVQAHHGSVAPERRQQLEQSLKNAEIPGIICTSSLEMGIDMGAIDCVVQYGSPKSTTAGLQRVGRSGHADGRVRKGRFFSPHPNDLLECAAVAADMSKEDIAPLTPPTLCLDVLAQHIVSIACTGHQSAGTHTTPPPTTTPPVPSQTLWTVEEILRLVRRAEPFAALSRPQIDNVVRMLEGGFADERFHELSPRLTHDKSTDLLHPRPGSQRLAILNGGTIPDRGEFTVRLETGERPAPILGELDEEFVGDLGRDQTPFILGSSTWKALRVDHSNVYVRPAPGEPAEAAFWKGERRGRDTYLGRHVAGLAAEIEEKLDDKDALHALLVNSCHLAPPSAQALEDYVRRQKKATGIVPSARAVPVEWFHDEIGDLRIVLHSLFGTGVNGTWAHALKPVIRNRFHNLDPQVMWTSDGIILRLPEMKDPPDLSFLQEIHAGNVHELLIGELADAPMYALRFRESAQRALLLPRPSPTRRTPLWLQRQRAADLLQIVRHKTGFPVMQEAVRECYQEIWDVEGTRSLLRDIEAGEITMPEVALPFASPFAHALEWAFQQEFGEAADAPRGECRAAFLSLNRELLAEVLHVEELRSLLDPAVIVEIQDELAWRSPRHKARSRADILALLADLGDLSTAEILERSTVTTKTCDTTSGTVGPVVAPQDWIKELAGQGSILLHPVTQRWVRAADANQRPISLALRHLQWAGPLTCTAVASRYKLSEKELLDLLLEQEGNGALISGHYLPDGHEREWCRPDTIQRLHRLSLARARAKIAPVSLPHYADFLKTLHLPTKSKDKDGPALQQAIDSLRNLPAPVSSWREGLLPARVGPLRPGSFDLAQSSGQFVWWGRGRGLAVVSQRGEPPRGLYGPEERARRAAHTTSDTAQHNRKAAVTAAPARNAPLPVSCFDSTVDSTPDPTPDPTSGPTFDAASTLDNEDHTARNVHSVHSKVREILGRGGGWFASELATQIGVGTDEITEVLYRLLWQGVIACDGFASLHWWQEVWLPETANWRAKTDVLSAPGRWQDAQHALQWRDTSPASPPPTDSRPARRQSNKSRKIKAGFDDEAAYQVADDLLQRYRVVTKQAFTAERLDISWYPVFRELQRRERRGEVARGYFLQGLQGSQFAKSATIDALRDHTLSEEPCLLAGSDPVNLWGRFLPLPSTADPTPEATSTAPPVARPKATPEESLTRDTPTAHPPHGENTTEKNQQTARASAAPSQAADALLPPFRRGRKTPWVFPAHRWKARNPGSYLVLQAGVPHLLIAKKGKEVWTLPGITNEDLVRSLTELTRLALWRSDPVRVYLCDNKSVLHSLQRTAFEAAGFIPRGASMMITPEEALKKTAKT